MTADRPDPVRGKIAEIPRELYDAWDAAKTRASVWRAAAASLEDEIREAISTITMPSLWKLVAIANSSPKVSMAHARISGAVDCSNSGVGTNLYRV